MHSPTHLLNRLSRPQRPICIAQIPESLSWRQNLRHLSQMRLRGPFHKVHRGFLQRPDAPCHFRPQPRGHAQPSLRPVLLKGLNLVPEEVAAAGVEVAEERRGEVGLVSLGQGAGKRIDGGFEGGGEGAGAALVLGCLDGAVEGSAGVGWVQPAQIETKMDESI